MFILITSHYLNCFRMDSCMKSWLVCVNWVSSVWWVRTEMCQHTGNGASARDRVLDQIPSTTIFLCTFMGSRLMISAIRLFNWSQTLKCLVSYLKSSWVLINLWITSNKLQHIDLIFYIFEGSQEPFIFSY